MVGRGLVTPVGEKVHRLTVEQDILAFDGDRAETEALRRAVGFLAIHQQTGA